MAFHTHVSLAPGTASWRLKDSLLKDAAILEQISELLGEYFRLNDTEDISPPYFGQLIRQ